MGDGDWWIALAMYGLEDISLDVVAVEVWV
jgi:hypothetical protein